VAVRDVVGQAVEARELVEIHTTRLDADQEGVLDAAGFEGREDRGGRGEELAVNAHALAHRGEGVLEMRRGVPVTVQRARQLLDEVEREARLTLFGGNGLLPRACFGERALVGTRIIAPEGPGEAV
jgi:hypothetical protein